VFECGWLSEENTLSRHEGKLRVLLDQSKIKENMSTNSIEFLRKLYCYSDFKTSKIKLTDILSILL